jgi:hypothetical protein
MAPASFRVTTKREEEEETNQRSNTTISFLLYLFCGRIVCTDHDLIGLWKVRRRCRSKKLLTLARCVCLRSQ